ncbi:MAG: lycopene cyclase domain-containing protein [Verrucomicrobiota bacterium]
MTYLYFHLVFILPVIVVVWYLRRHERVTDIPFQKSGIAVLALIAFAYTTPWDNYLVASQIWTYGEGRVLESWVIGYVPIEEYAFFILQPIMTGSFLLLFAGRQGLSLTKFNRPLKRLKPAWIGGGVFVLLSLFGVACLVAFPERFTYLGLILAWACPVLAFQWFYGGGTLWDFRSLLIASVKIPTIYLWVVDLIAIEWRIWLIMPKTSTGWMLITLPIEEAVFFLLTNLLVVQGLILFYQAASRWVCRGKGLRADSVVTT